RCYPQRSSIGPPAMRIFSINVKAVPHRRLALSIILGLVFSSTSAFSQPPSPTALTAAAVAETLPEPTSNDPGDARLRAELDEILRAPELAKAFVGVHVMSLTDGRTLFDHNGSKLFNPASNMKILTTASALWYLGPSYRFRTEARRDAKMKDGVLDG